MTGVQTCALPIWPQIGDLRPRHRPFFRRGLVGPRRRAADRGFPCKARCRSRHNVVMDRLASLFCRAADPRPDGELLAAFLGERDGDAFAELVRRHGPTVWGVCRRALPDLADAEDAFQATFLVLVRRASRLVATPTVGAWLFEVAVRTAANARRKNAHRLARIAGLPDAIADPRPAAAPAADLDKILHGLPERQRAVLLMCYVEGLTHREAAGRLGCAEGTVSSLVSRGLARLRAVQCWELHAPCVIPCQVFSRSRGT